MSGFHALLAERVEAQTLACIGCNDCLLACPLPQARTVTIGELNGVAHLPLIGAENVAGFVMACTQCQQCVPVCPADLSRADMVLWNKLKVEDNAPDQELLLQARTVTIASGWTLDKMSQKLTQLELFHGAAPRDLRRMLLKSTLRFVVPGEELCREGDFHERLSIVLHGSIEQVSRGSRGERMRILVLGPGSFFGEMGVLGGVPEAFGSVALETSIVLEMPKYAVASLIAQAPGFETVISALYARRALYNYARTPGALGVLPEAAVEELMRGAVLGFLAASETLFVQADKPSEFYLVHSGFLRVRRADRDGERVLVYWREGQLFGLFGLLSGEQGQPYGVEAASRAAVVRFSGAALERVLALYPTAREPLLHAAYEAERLARATDIGKLPLVAASSGALERQSSFGTELSTEVLLDEGIVTGREVLVVDQNLCTNCGNCIDSCERRHGYSRLQLRGLQVDHYLFPTACRHCEDPACLLCSVNGIVRTPTGEIKIVEENCIGCGACAQRCPYGNIQMHPVERSSGWLFSVLDLLGGFRSRSRALAALDPKAPRLAVKCDLCAGYGDYACVTACPVAAAFRINPASVFGML